MKFEWLRKQQEVLNKITGEKCIVMQVDKETQTATVSPDPEAENPVTYTVRPDTAIAFRFLHDPNSFDIPAGFTTHEGILLKDGQPYTEQGDLRIDYIVKAMPGLLVLAVKPREEKDPAYNDLYVYKPMEDRFAKIGSSYPNLWEDAKRSKEDLLVMTYNKVYDEFDENGNPERFFGCAGVIVYDGKRLKNFESPVPFGGEILSMDELSVIVSSKASVGEEKLLTEKEEATFYRLVDKGDAKALFSEKAHLLEVGMVYENDTMTFVFDDKVVFLALGGEATERMTIPKDSLKGFCYLVDKTKAETGEVIYTFMDREMTMAKRLSVKETKDRGLVKKYL